MLKTLKWNVLTGMLVGALLAGAAGAAWAPNAVVRSVVGAAGASATGSGVVANGTLAQSTPLGTATGGGLILRAGFWAHKRPGATGVDTPEIPAWPTALLGNFPNPFNPQTCIEFTLAERVSVRLEVFDAQGRLVRELVAETRPAGQHQVAWNGTDDGGRRVASGLYFFRLQAGAYKSVNKMTLIK